MLGQRKRLGGSILPGTTDTARNTSPAMQLNGRPQILNSMLPLTRVLLGVHIFHPQPNDLGVATTSSLGSQRSKRALKTGRSPDKTRVCGFRVPHGTSSVHPFSMLQVTPKKCSQIICN